MNKIAFALSTLIPSLLLTTPAFADSGFYAELSAGSAKNKAKTSISSTFTSYYSGEAETEMETEVEKSSDDSTSFGLRFGYQFNDYIAVEIAHHQYGEWDDNSIDESGDSTNAKLDSSSISAGVKGILPLSDDFSLFARAGIAKWDFKATVTDSSMPDEVFRLKEDDNDIYYGIGAEYSVNESISLGLEYSVIDMDWAVSNSETNENYSYSTDVKTNYTVESIALLLKVSF